MEDRHDRSASAEVKRGSVVLVSPTVLPATVEDTFGSLLDKVGNSMIAAG